MKFCVIGLGRFGSQVAVALADQGMEVLGIDSNEATVATLRDRITHAICMRASDEPSLRAIGIEEMDTVIVAMGKNFAQSILVTALLKQKLHIPRVIARAVNEIHQEILSLIGADHVVLPEQEIGKQLADTLSAPFNMLFLIAPHYALSQQRVPDRFVGEAFGTLQLLEEYNVQCLGLKTDSAIIPLEPDSILQDNDVLLLAGYHKDLARIAEL